MKRLRLRPDVEEYVATWSITATGEDRECIAKFLETLADGSWETYHPDPYLPDPAWTKVWPTKGLMVAIRTDVNPTDDEQDYERWVEAMSIVRVPEGSEDDIGLPLP